MVYALALSSQDNQHPSVRALQRSKSFHKVVHNISLWLALTIFTSRLLSLLLRPLPLLLLTEGGTSLHGHEGCAARLEPRRNPAQRLALSALLLVFPRTEVFLAASRVGRDHRAAIGLHFKNVRLESEGIDKLPVGREIFHVVLCTVADRTTYVCVYALWERVDVWGQLYLETSYTGKRIRMRKTMWSDWSFTYWSRNT
jgi:hypothetical protein